MDEIDIKERDVDMEEIRRICSEKTIEELDADFKKFKKNLQKSTKTIKASRTEVLFSCSNHG